MSQAYDSTERRLAPPMKPPEPGPSPGNQDSNTALHCSTLPCRWRLAALILMITKVSRLRTTGSTEHNRTSQTKEVACLHKPMALSLRERGLRLSDRQSEATCACAPQALSPHACLVDAEAAWNIFWSGTSSKQPNSRRAIPCFAALSAGHSSQRFSTGADRFGLKAYSAAWKLC